jgi:hypothetical protein
MNRPIEYGGFSFYQSGWDEQGGRQFSFLSVSDNAGQATAFTGFVAMIVGMIIVLGTRMKDRRMIRRAQELAAETRPRIVK